MREEMKRTAQASKPIVGGNPGEGHLHCLPRAIGGLGRTCFLALATACAFQ